jgi:L-alanine-DL-glutamate epimerase-like enolase superfamily enzyme
MTPAATIAGVTWRRIVASDRAAVIVVVTTTRGMFGVGEAAPLPGRSIDDVAAADRAMAALAARVPIPLDGDVATAAAGLAAAITPAAAARFAIETAVLDAVARDRGVTLAELLAPAPALAVPINALVHDVAGALAATARGITTLKVKLGADDEAVARLRAIRAAVGPGVRLRADVNRGWRECDALGRLAALVDLDLEYVEEPCRGMAGLAGRTPIPLAYDETLAGLDDAEIGRILTHGIGAVVIKPTMVGGLGRARAIAVLAARRGIDAVVTHAFEGPVAAVARSASTPTPASPRGPGPRSPSSASRP